MFFWGLFWGVVDINGFSSPWCYIHNYFMFFAFLTDHSVLPVNANPQWLRLSAGVLFKVDNADSDGLGFFTLKGSLMIVLF